MNLSSTARQCRFRILRTCYVIWTPWRLYVVQVSSAASLLILRVAGRFERALTLFFEWAKAALFLFIFVFSWYEVLGTQTRCSRMVGTGESNELWRHPALTLFSKWVILWSLHYISTVDKLNNYRVLKVFFITVRHNYTQGCLNKSRSYLLSFEFEHFNNW